MPEPTTPAVKLIVAALVSKDSERQAVMNELEKAFGPLDFVSEAMPFDITDYYESEMGADLMRVFGSFERLVNPSDLAAFKRRAMDLETTFARPDGSRTVNLDVGYIDPHKLILASVKEGGQKIYIGDGVWADPTLFYRKGDWHNYEWGFPDFTSGRYNAILLKIRKLYKNQRKIIFSEIT